MANTTTQGNKTVRCRHNHPNIIPFQTTFFKCYECDEYVLVYYFGTITDRDGNYIY